MKFWLRHALPYRWIPAALAAVLLLAPVEGRAQIPQEVRARLESLGLSDMTPAEIRQQLSNLGFDPAVLDPYLTGEATVEDQGLNRRAQTALTALRSPAARGAGTDSLRAEMDAVLPDSSEMEREMGLRVFGLRTFARATTEFESLATGPVPPGYVLGPGDEVVLILTGDVQQDYVMPVTREGFIVIPNAGKVWVNGLTMEELRDRLYPVLGQVYSGIGRSPEATTQFEASLGRLRANQVFVNGEVRRPGTYATGPLASVLNSLYLAGGPLPTGSYRDIRILRSGEVIERVDLYAYLTQGDNMAHLILAPGDVVFVPPPGPQVALRGAVTRRGIYELIPGETLLDALDYAGGLTAPAAIGLARITRIVPPTERSEPGFDRTVLDVDLAAVLRGQEPAPELYDGDQVRIFRVRPELRKIVTVSGAVWKSCRVEDTRDQSPEEREQATPPVQAPVPVPGDTTQAAADSATIPPPPDPRIQDRQRGTPCTFRFRPGMRAWDAIEAAEGLRPEAYRENAQIVRVDPSDSTLSVLTFSLDTGADGSPVENPELREFDAIRVFSRTEFRDSLVVRLSGEVRRPGNGSFRFHEGMTLQDLLLEAGGLTPEADLMVEVSRRPGAEERRRGRLAETVQIPVDESYIISREGIRFYAGDLEQDDDGREGAAASFRLRPYDHVFVRRVPNLAEGERTVVIAGEVSYPGRYALQSKDERLSQIVERAGGLAATAFADGFRLYRNGELVNIELPSALRDPGGSDDLILLPGDSMVVPEYNPVVLVQGAVNSPAAVLYQEGADLEYYIAQAGGYHRHADRDHVNVRFANGEGAVREQVLMFHRSPRPGPGSTIDVPRIPAEERRDFLATLGDIAQVTGSVLTTLLILTRF